MLRGPHLPTQSPTDDAARPTGFRNFIGRAIDSGSADRWEPKTHNPSLGAADGWFVGTPGMSALVKPLADELDIRFLTEVTEIHREKDAWRVRTSRDNSGDLFDLVVCCAPAPQTRALVASTQEMASALAKVSMAPCWALMLSLVTAIDPGFEVWRSKSDNLAWISRNSSKPQRPAELDNWVAHASPDWSRRHLELDRGQVAELMLEMLTRRFGGQLPEIEHLSAHRWRYAMTTAPLGKPYICSEDRTLFVGGDWCLGARVESAHESGQLIANAIMDAL